MDDQSATMWSEPPKIKVPTLCVPPPSGGAPREVRLRASCSCHRKLRQDLPARDDLVDGPIFHGLLGGQLVQQFAVPDDLLGLALDVHGLALDSTVRLVQ